MKKHINSVGSMSSIVFFTVIVLGTMLCSFGAMAHNKPTENSNSVAEEIGLENSIEEWMTSDVFWADLAESDETIEKESDNSLEYWMLSNSITDVESQNIYESEIADQIQSWINNGIYWSDFDFSLAPDMNGHKFKHRNRHIKH